MARPGCWAELRLSAIEAKDLTKCFCELEVKTITHFLGGMAIPTDWERLVSILDFALDCGFWWVLRVSATGWDC